MIGFIAGAGIIVRNSIILVDFIELKLREGMPLAAAVEEAGVVRFRPMLLTAAAVMVGSAVMLADPIFQGLAVALMAGEVAATLLSRARRAGALLHAGPPRPGGGAAAGGRARPGAAADGGPHAHGGGASSSRTACAPRLKASSFTAARAARFCSASRRVARSASSGRSPVAAASAPRATALFTMG